MTISHIVGFEMGSLSEAIVVQGSMGSVVSSPVRSGSYSYRSATGGTGYLVFTSRAAGGTFRNLYQSVRFYLRIATLPGAGSSNILATQVTSANALAGWQLRLNADGTFSLLDSGGFVLVTSASALTTGTDWHRIDVDAGWNGGTGVRLFVDGTQWATEGAVAVTVTAGGRIGVVLGSSTHDLYFDDVVWYDSELPATLTDYNVGLLLPNADSADGGWVEADGAGNTDLYTGVDNVPPTGSTATTVGTRIENSVSSATDNYDAVCANYDTFPAGGGAPQTVEYLAGGVSTANIGHSSGPYQHAESFTWAGDFQQALVKVAKLGTPTDDLVVEIQTDSAGSPSGTVVATGSIAGAELTTSFVVTSIALDGGPVAGPPATYWIVLRRSGSLSPLDYYRTIIVGSNPYAGAHKTESGSGWTSDTNDMYFSVSGVTNSPIVLAVQAITNDAQAVTTGSPKAGAVVITANPSGQTEQSFDYGLPNGTSGSTSAAAMGTFPAGWGTHVGPVTESPSVTLSSGPTVRVGKRTSTTREVDVDFLGVYVMYEPPASSRPRWLREQNLRRRTPHRSGRQRGMAV